MVRGLLQCGRHQGVAPPNGGINNPRVSNTPVSNISTGHECVKHDATGGRNPLTNGGWRGADMV